MNAFENIDNLDKMYPVWGVHLAISLVVALMILGLAIFFFCKYLQWKHYWKQDSEYFDGQLNEEQNANVSLMNENTELKDRLKNMAVDSDLYNNYWHEAEVINSDLEDKLKIADVETTQLKNELKRLEVADLKAINGLLDKINELKERYHNSCDEVVEQLNQINYLQDKLAKSANRVALTEGKLRAKSSKERAMELTLAFLCDAENEDLPGLVDATWKVIHKNIVQQ